MLLNIVVVAVHLASLGGLVKQLTTTCVRGERCAPFGTLSITTCFQKLQSVQVPRKHFCCKPSVTMFAATLHAVKHHHLIVHIDVTRRGAEVSRASKCAECLLTSRKVRLQATHRCSVKSKSEMIVHTPDCMVTCVQLGAAVRCGDGGGRVWRNVSCACCVLVCRPCSNDGGRQRCRV